MPRNSLTIETLFYFSSVDNLQRHSDGEFINYTLDSTLVVDESRRKANVAEFTRKFEQILLGLTLSEGAEEGGDNREGEMRQFIALTKNVFGIS